MNHFIEGLEHRRLPSATRFDRVLIDDGADHLHAAGVASRQAAG
jgi:hypothetical protein